MDRNIIYALLPSAILAGFLLYMMIELAPREFSFKVLCVLSAVAVVFFVVWSLLI
jgi:hypothetical protein